MPTALVPVLTTATLEQSYGYCRGVARQRAKNFYYSFLLLEKPRRDAMCAIYAFMRECDDLSDDPAATDKAKLRQTIAHWRVQTDHALNGEVEGGPIWPAFHDTVKRYRIPHRFFHEMIDGIASDLLPREIQTFDELYRYCYQVASVVGLTIIHIFGFQSPRALLLAEKCGVAFQLTNILRDVREDALLGRVYLPAEDLARFGVPAQQLRDGVEDGPFRELMRFEGARAQVFYELSAPLASMIKPRSRASLWALRAIYLKLLTRLERSNYSVLTRRINVPARTKLGILVRAFLYPRPHDIVKLPYK
jgi:phytoene synthase